MWIGLIENAHISLAYNYSDGTQFKCDSFGVKQLFELELIYIFLFFVINKLKINSESPQKTWDMLRYSERNRLINVQYKCQRINVPKTKPNVFFFEMLRRSSTLFLSSIWHFRWSKAILLTDQLQKLCGRTKSFFAVLAIQNILWWWWRSILAMCVFVYVYYGRKRPNGKK